ncbi:hypothetical protein CVT26_004796 [Gymnopilus dilepis]|uniref:DUF803-domain-containing protein n=1 Tax=Gymnopilus dilepis TaxID=231916 RepID=A0A409XZM1_9AGAR|nr:hypothetical protein CVT26_004796 [Gymnopilus dilepis]
MSSTISPSITQSVAAASSSAAAKTLSAGPNLKVVGIILAIASGTLIGSSFVFKKKGLLRSQAGGELGEGVAYLKSPLWWTGMTMMILGELCNFAGTPSFNSPIAFGLILPPFIAAYAFVEAIVVTPLGALSVVICAILSSFFLNEKLSFFGWLGCTLCILGSVIIALNGPQEQTVGEITQFQKLFLAPGFLVWIGLLITAALIIVFYFAPRYGKKSMLWYIFVCSMIGGISVSVTTGLGAAIVQTAMGDNQFKHWFMYFLFGFVAITLLVEVYYLNVALALFNTAMVTPTYYVIFTFFSMVTTIVLFKGLHTSVTGLLTLIIGFLVICIGITILQMSKVDPEKLKKLDRRSTILLQAAREKTEAMDEKGVIGYEDPGIDTLRGSFGTVGSIIRARTMRRMSQSQGSNGNHLRMRPPGAAAPYDPTVSWLSQPGLPSHPTDGLRRHQLYDAPMPRDDASSIRAPSVISQQGPSNLVPKKPTIIKFDNQELVHSYSRPGQPQSPATHEHRQAIHGSMIVHDGYPPLPPLPASSSTSRDSAAVSEGNLLEIDEENKPTRPTASQSASASNIPLLPPPINSRSPSSEPIIQQTVVVPSHLKDSVGVHSAPPTMYRGFAKPPPGLSALSGGPAGSLNLQQQNQSPKRKDSRDIFDTEGLSTAGTRGTLLSFPSVTDSAVSEWDQEELKKLGAASSKASGSGSARSSLAAPEKKEKEKSRERSKSRERVKTPKKYPKGLGDDDKEESERLWVKGPGSLEEDDGNLLSSVDSSPELPSGSIRLVTKSSGGTGSGGKI